MATRDVVVRIRAEIGAFRKDMDTAAAKAKETAQKTEAAGKSAESGIGRLTQVAKEHETAWSQVSTGMVAGGAAIVGALALSTKEAMSWESAWTGVLKTIDEGEAKFYGLEDGLRGLARTLPSTHTEIAAVAEAAGQLGIQTENVLAFTKTMIDLGESTNMSAEQGAMELARFMNIMGTAQGDVGRLGATIVGLGNNFAATESEIMAMSMRLASAGKLAGLSEGQVMGLATSMAAVGIEAEAGGTAMTQVLTKIGKAVDEGGDKLGVFAKTSGMTSEQFQKAWKEDASTTLDTLLKGLGQVEAGGQSMNAVLDEMGIKGIRESLAMKNLALASAGVGEAMTQGAEEYAKGTALVEEATKRYETAESKVKMAWNSIKDAAIDAGSVILPVVAGIAEVVADLAGWFSDLPDPVQTALTALAGIAGVGALAAGGLMKIVSWLPDTVAGLQALGVDAPKATRAVGTFGKTLGGITTVGTGLLIGKEAIEAINNAVRSGKPQVEEYFNLLSAGGGSDIIDAMKLDLGAGGLDGFMFPQAYVDSVKDYYGAHSEGAAAAKQALDVGGHGGLVGWVTRNLSTGDVRRASEDWLQMAEAGKAVARAFEMGEHDLGVSALKSMQTELYFNNEDIAKLINQVPELRGALTQIATDGGIKIDPDDELGLVDIALGRIKVSAPEAGDALSGLGDGVTDDLGGIGDAAQDAADAIDDFYAAMVNAGMVVLGEREALRSMQAAFDAAGAAAKENGKNLDITTEKGRANQAALDGIASSTLKAMEAQRSAGATAGELGATISEGREAFIKNAVAMGMNADKAAALADQMNLIPGAVYMTFDSNLDDLGVKLTEIHELVQSTPDGKVTIEENSPMVIEALRDLGYIVTELPDGQIEVSETGTDETGKKIDETAGKKRTAKIDAEAVTEAAERQLNFAARARTAAITMAVLPGVAGQVLGGAQMLLGGQKDGGRLPGLDSGGRLPATGLGTDKILGVNPSGTPLAWVDDREWVVNRKSSDKYNGVIAAINDDHPSVQHLAGFRDGGQIAVPASREVANYASAQAQTVVNIDVAVHGATDERRVAQTVVDKIGNGLAAQGVNIGRISIA